uniref:acyclic terpene utilization AtuA family protein n=1 Tax=Symmachiella dynata TaxID=2527995 RepID=UPI0030EF4A2A
MTSIRVGNAAGFWGDNLDAPRLLCESGQLDYLTLEYLAELTLSILAHLKSRDHNAGFVSDFPTVVESLIPQLRAQPNLKIVTNAGGMHPSACAVAVSTILQKGGMKDVRVAAVAGDDLLPQLDTYLDAGEPF